MSLFPNLATRLREEEWMDAPDADPATLDRSLRFIRRVNSLLRYTRTTLSHLEEFSRSWKPGDPISILDVATGSADVPRAILRWAEEKRLNVRAVGLDRHALTAKIARQEADGKLGIVRGDAISLPFADGSFDYVITSMFLHHLDDDDVAKVLREMNRVARRGVIAADLLRNQRAYFWITLFTLFSGPMVRHDARVSVAQAFTELETLALRDRAGISYAKFHRHFGHRFILAGEKT